MKNLARYEAAELFIRHVQIEPLLYQHILQQRDVSIKCNGTKLNTIDGDFSLDEIHTVLRNRMTVGHDKLSYEIVDRFDKSVFLGNLDYIRTTKPKDHNELSKEVLEANRKHSFQLLGPTNVVLLIVM